MYNPKDILRFARHNATSSVMLCTYLHDHHQVETYWNEEKQVYVTQELDADKYAVGRALYARTKAAAATNHTIMVEAAVDASEASPLQFNVKDAAMFKSITMNADALCGKLDAIIDEAPAALLNRDEMTVMRNVLHELTKIAAKLTAINKAAS